MTPAEQGITRMSSYCYTVSTNETAAIYTNRKAAIQAACLEAKAGRMAMVWKGVADDNGVIRTNLGRIHTSFPKSHA